MASGTLDIRLRPIKLALLVEDGDFDALEKAIELNSFLWGGKFNPIIPFSKKIHKNWAEDKFYKLTASSLVIGYINAYDPDYIVAIGKCATYDLPIEIEDERKVKYEDIIKSIREYGAPLYGIGLLELMADLAKNELTYVRHEPIGICNPSFVGPSKVFLKAFLGCIMPESEDIYSKGFKQMPCLKEEECSMENYHSLIKKDVFLPLRISSLHLEQIPRDGYYRENYLFLMDANSHSDIIKYWNFRALGRNVLPVPKQNFDKNEVKALAKKFIDDYFSYNRHNPSISNSINIISCKSITDKERDDFIQSLSLENDKNGQSKLMLSNYPRLWSYHRRHDHGECCDIISKKESHDIGSEDEKINPGLVSPVFMHDYMSMGLPRFANEVVFRMYGTKEPVAEIIPEGNGEFVRNSNISRDHWHWRASKRGLVHLSDRLEGTIDLSIPKAENIFLGWLTQQNLKGKLSSAGLITKQMIRQLDGIRGLSILAYEEMIKLLSKFSEEKAIGAKDLKTKLHILSKTMDTKPTPEIITKILVEDKVLRIGIEIQCEICRQHIWYSIDEMNYELRCTKCLAMNKLPAHDTTNLKWSYKPYGPFSLPGQAYGSYATALALRFFSTTLDGATTPILSFDMESNAGSVEIDLALFLQESKHYSSDSALIFAECKTNNEFKREDINKMALIAKQFPGSIMAFTTLNEKLSPKEKKLLKPIALSGRKYFEQDKPTNPVLILTGNELFSRDSIFRKWEKMGGKHKELAARNRIQDIFNLCDATQQIYLDMEPTHQTWEKHWTNRRRRRAAKN